MNLLNLGCGNTRPSNFINLDDLRAQLAPDTPERVALDLEENYRNFDVRNGPLPFEPDSFDGVLASHFFEHFDAQEGLRIMLECRRILRPDGVLLVSVPDASYFRCVYPRDRKENWPQLFGVHDPANTIKTFFEAALWFDQHKAIFTKDALWSYFVRARFHPVVLVSDESEGWPVTAIAEHPSVSAMLPHLNRRQFSLEMIGVK